MSLILTTCLNGSILSSKYGSFGDRIGAFNGGKTLNKPDIIADVVIFVIRLIIICE